MYTVTAKNKSNTLSITCLFNYGLHDMHEARLNIFFKDYFTTVAVESFGAARRDRH
jgi:hypothetical protein